MRFCVAVVTLVTLTVALSATVPGLSGQAAATTGGTLNVGYDFSSEFSNTFDPARSQSECDSLVTEPIYGFLLTRNAKDQIEPGLASAWSIGNDTLTLTLRPGLTFSDGEPFDAQAVKDGILHNQSNTMFTELHAVTGADVLNPTTVRIDLKDNSGVRLAYALTQSSGEIPAPSTLKSSFSHPIGAGPFKFVSYAEGSNLTLARSPTYYAATTYKLGGLRFVQVGSGPPSVTALLSGSVDYVRLQADSYAAVPKGSNYGLVSRPSSDYLQVAFRFSGPFTKKLVRQAVNLAIDRNAINAVVLDGKGQVATQPFPTSSPVHVSGLVGSNHYNPSAAKKDLTAAGYPHGFDFTLVIPGGGIALEERLATLVQSELGAIGVHVKIQRVLGDDLYTSFLVEKQGNALAAENTDNPYPPLLLGQFASNDFAAVALNAVNPQINAILTKADNSTSLSAIDAFGRQGNEVDVNQALEVPIAFLPQIVAWNTRAVHGTVSSPLNTCAPDNFAELSASK